MALFDTSMVSSSIKKAAEIKKIPVKPTPYPIGINSYPACCGARILTGFPVNKGNEARLNLFLENTLKQFPGYQLHCTLKEGGQETNYGPVLIKKGFKKIAVFNNPNSGYDIHSYVYSGREPKRAD